MKKTIYTAIMLCVAGTMMAEGLDLGSKMQLRRIRTEQAQGSEGKSVSPVKKATGAAIATSQTTQVMAMLKFAEGYTDADLEAEGITVLKVRGDIAVVLIPIDDVERAASLPSIKQLQISRDAQVKMDLARSLTGIDKIHSGEGLSQAYTGKGVVTGIVDSGIDPNHINFKKEDGSSRILQLSHIRANAAGTGVISSVYTPDDPVYNISYFESDATSSYHGSHTLGIMAGGYRGNITYAQKTGEHDAEIIENQPNPFYGGAYESDIVASCGTLADGFIALGVESILDYAYEHQQPCVINLSLGNNTGGHDGLDVLNQYLTLAGEEAVICISSGNEGDHGVALHKDFTADDNTLQSFLYPFYFSADDYKGTSYYKANYGAMYLYSADDSAFDVQVVVYNKSRGRIAQRFTVPSEASESATYYISSEDYREESTDVLSAQFGQYFNGHIGFGSAYDENSGRYYVLLDVYAIPNADGLNANDNYLLGFVITGKDGQHIDCYSDATATSFTSYGIDGWAEGDANGSINSMACGDNVVIVGAYNERDDWGVLGGTVYGYATHYTPGEISDYSSFGTLLDGRNLPHVCAPGTSIVSSTNNYYLYDSSNMMTPDILSAYYENDDRDNYWVVSAGTSMACPVVAGGIALWLEADPTLTVNDVKEIIANTSNKDEYVTEYTGDPVKWGAGKFDAYAGLKEVLRRSGIQGVVNDKVNNRLIVNSDNDNQFTIFVGGVQKMNIALYSAAGQQVMQKSVNSDETTLDASALDKGVYILNVNGQYNTKIIVK